MVNRVKHISFGKFAVRSARKVNEITVDVFYGEDETLHLPSFSACGAIWNKPHTEMFLGGQCLDSLNNIICHSDISVEKFDLWKTIYGLWKRNHCNTMRPYANKAQKDAINEYLKTHNNEYDYELISNYLKERDIYYVYVDGKKCGYGEGWYYEQISSEDEKLIETIFAKK